MIELVRCDRKGCVVLRVYDDNARAKASAVVGRLAVRHLRSTGLWDRAKLGNGYLKTPRMLLELRDAAEK